MSEEIVYGIHPVRQALESRGHQIREIWISRKGTKDTVRKVLARARELDVKVRSHDRQRLDARAGTTNHQGILAFVSPYAYADLQAIVQAALNEKPGLIVALDGIDDPQNLGSLIRTAYMCGAHGVIVPKDRAAPLTAAVAKASAGALEHTRVARVTNLVRTLERLQQKSIWVVGLSMEADHLIYELDLCQPTALVVGGEAKGIRPRVKQTCDFLAGIPQQGRLNSLNAAAAAAMALYETMRQRLMAFAQR
jgi:23S rRNA (guanosine2251-2'-O)-methyltransferase